MESFFTYQLLEHFLVLFKLEIEFCESCQDGLKVGLEAKFDDLTVRVDVLNPLTELDEDVELAGAIVHRIVELTDLRHQHLVLVFQIVEHLLLRINFLDQRLIHF